MEIPSVEIPQREIPEVEIPEVEIPEMEILAVQITEVELLEIEIPEVEIPEDPEEEIPEIEVEIPEVDTSGRDNMANCRPPPLVLEVWNSETTGPGGPPTGPPCEHILPPSSPTPGPLQGPWCWGGGGREERVQQVSLLETMGRILLT